jgi:hypothetical protein
MPMTFDNGHPRAINAIDQRHAHQRSHYYLTVPMLIIGYLFFVVVNQHTK